MKRDLAIRALKHLGRLLRNAPQVNGWRLLFVHRPRAAFITRIVAASIVHSTIKRSCADIVSKRPLSCIAAQYPAGQ